MTNTTQLLPCPFCGSGSTIIKENGKVWLGSRHSQPTSVSIVHWCPATLGQPSRAIERVGRDYNSAVAAWNLRSPSMPQRIAAQDVEWITSEYERLARWRARWTTLSAKREPNRLQSRQERIDAKAQSANNAIGALMRTFDQTSRAAGRSTSTSRES